MLPGWRANSQGRSEGVRLLRPNPFSLGWLPGPGLLILQNRARGTKGEADWHLFLSKAPTALPLVVWLMRGFFEDLPVELEEAAWIDGASRYLTFGRIVLPLAKPGIAAAGILLPAARVGTIFCLPRC